MIIKISIRQISLVLFASLLLATSCGKKSDYDSLNEAWPLFDEVYALKNTHPDSAYRLMEAIADTLSPEEIRQFSAFQYFEYQLLLSELAFKGFKPIANEKELLEAFGFYDSVVNSSFFGKKDKELNYQLARSYYYKGVVDNRSGKTLDAFNDYLRALQLMDGLTGKRRAFVFWKPNLDYEHFTALIYDRLAFFLFSCDAWEVALDALESSNECFLKENNRHGIAGNLEMMGNVMLAQSNHMEAIDYYKKSDSIHSQLHTDNAYQQFSTLMHDCYDLYYGGEKDSAYMLLHSVLDRTHNEFSRKMIGYTLGYFYYDDQMLDSALNYFERSYPLLPGQTLKSYSRCVPISNALGDSLKAARYANLLADPYLERVSMESEKTTMISLFEQYKADKGLTRQKDWVYFISFMVVLLILILTIDSYFLYRRKLRHKLDQAEHERIKASLEDKIEMTEEKTRQKEEKIKVLESELEKVVNNPDFQKLPFDMKLETLYKMPISKRVRTVTEANVKAFSSYPELVLSENQLTMLVNAVDAVFPKFSVRIIEMFPRLKRSDVMYCCLYILGITEVQAAALTGKTYQAVWRRSLKLHEIFGNKSNLQLVLYGFLKDW